MIKAISAKDDVRITVNATDERVILDIFNDSGIGQAELEITSQELPRRILMRFHLRGLEELRFTYNETVVTASLLSTGEQDSRQSVSRAGGKPLETQAITANSPFWMKMHVVSRDKSNQQIPLRDGYIEVEAPEHFLKGDYRKASIQWIDFYR